jgi:hypothetical protein
MRVRSFRGAASRGSRLIKTGYLGADQERLQRGVGAAFELDLVHAGQDRRVVASAKGASELGNDICRCCRARNIAI